MKIVNKEFFLFTSFWKLSLSFVHHKRTQTELRFADNSLDFVLLQWLFFDWKWIRLFSNWVGKKLSLVILLLGNWTFHLSYFDRLYVYYWRNNAWWDLIINYEFNSFIYISFRHKLLYSCKRSKIIQKKRMTSKTTVWLILFV